jgi:ribosome-associated translation inhibitor RaiA
MLSLLVAAIVSKSTSSFVIETALNMHGVSIHALERSWEPYKAPRTSGTFEGTLQGA